MVRRPSSQAIPAARATLLAFALVVAVSACAATNVPPVMQSDFRPDADEASLWEFARKLDAHFDASPLPYRDEAVEQTLEKTTQRLLPHLGAADVAVRVRVLRDPYLNAFALPNGSVYVHTGLLAQMENEDQLATVLGHELSHFVQRHALKQKRSAENRRAVADAVITVLAVAAAGLAGDASAARLFLDLGDAIAQPVVQAQISGYSRDLEREADAQGFHGMVAAGYDARESPKIFHKLRAEREEAGVVEPYFFGSHPRLEERIDSYNRALGERGLATAGAVEPGRASPEFAAVIADLLLVNADLDADLGRYQRAIAAAERHLAHDPQSARGWVALGDLHRRAGDGEPQQRAALDAYENAARVDPDFAPAHRERALLYRTQGRLAEARTALELYMALAPDAVDAPILAAYLEKLGQSPAAAQGEN